MRLRPELPRVGGFFILTALAVAASAQLPAPPPSIRVAGFSTPESVLHDVAADVYLVSNISGSPLAKDDDGFISRVNPDGAVAVLKWIDGAAPNITLHAPKGMAIVGGTLYVTDIDAVRLFDRVTGAPKGEVLFPGATFLNDLAPANGGGVLVTDSGLKAGAAGFIPSGSAAVYRIGPDRRVETLLKDPALAGPNGVAADGTRVVVVTFGANELIAIEGGRKRLLATLPRGGLDGIEKLADGRWAVTSWEAQAVFIGSTAQPFTQAFSDLQAPADLGIDRKRNRLLIPKFQDNEIVIQPLER